MAELRELFDELGHQDVRTHILSGNVIFASRRTGVQTLERGIEAGIRARFGFDIRVLIRTAGELAAIVTANPLPEATARGDRFFVIFLDGAPDPERVRAIDPTA